MLRAGELSEERGGELFLTPRSPGKAYEEVQDEVTMPPLSSVEL